MEDVRKVTKREKVKVFDLNDLESREGTEQLIAEINALKGSGDVNSRFVHKDLGEVNVKRRALVDRYKSLMLQDSNSYYTSPLQPYNRFSDVTGEVCEFPLAKIIDPYGKLKRMVHPLTDEEKKARKLLVDFERTGKMPCERNPYLMSVSASFTFIRLLELHRWEEALLKVDRAMKLSGDEVDVATRKYYELSWLWLRRARSKILHHHLELKSEFSFSEQLDKRTRWLPDSERRKLYDEIVEFSKEVKVTSHRYRKREWFAKWNTSLEVPGFCLKALHTLPGKDKESLSRLSRRARNLTGYNMYEAKRRLDFYPRRYNNGNFRNNQNRNGGWGNSGNNNDKTNLKQRSPKVGGQRT